MRVSPFFAGLSHCEEGNCVSENVTGEEENAETEVEMG